MQQTQGIEKQTNNVINKSILFKHKQTIFFGKIKLSKNKNEMNKKY